MAIQAYGDWITVRNVVKLTSNDNQKAPVYKGDAFRVPSGITAFSQGDEIHFRDNDITSIYHTGTSQDFYFVREEDVILFDN